MKLSTTRISTELGQTMAEYSVVLAVVTVGIVTAIGLLSAAAQDRFGAVVSMLGGLV